MCREESEAAVRAVQQQLDEHVRASAERDANNTELIAQLRYHLALPTALFKLAPLSSLLFYSFLCFSAAVPFYVSRSGSQC